MEFKNFNGFFKNQNEKYIIYQKLCKTKFVALIGVNNFPFLRFLHIPHILVKKLKFRFQ